MNTPRFQYPPYIYRCEIVKVIDADTVDVNIDVGFGISVHKRLRFMNFDAWEVRGEEREKGLLAKARLQELIDTGENFFVQTVMDATGKYGRVLAWLWVEKPGGPLQNVIEILLEEGHGTEYGT